jgi:RNA polymerase sigma-70 factor (ECF subfamily)
MSDSGSVARLMERLQRCDDEAWRRVYDRFARRLLILASQRLDERLHGKVEAEDVVQSVFRTFCRRQAQGQFHPANWDELGQLLVRITICKCLNKNKHFLCKRRDASRETSPGDPDGAAMLDLSALDREPLPEEVLMLNETVERLLHGFSERDQKIVQLKLENVLTVDQMAENVGCAKRTAERVLGLARKRLLRELET